MGEKLAILGGPKTVTANDAEQWKPPIEEEKRIVCQLIESGELSGAGAGLPKEFEDEYRDYVGCQFCLTVDHGHTALASAFFAAGVGPGDEVITTTASYIGSYCGAMHIGARPVFCDIDPETLLIDPAEAERKITSRTRVIIAAHMNGKVCDMDSLLALARKHGIVVVEDAAHAHGCEWDGKKIGNQGDIACFSLQGIHGGGKPISGGEGGIVTTNNREFYERQLIYCHLHRHGLMKEITNPEYAKLDDEVLGMKYRAHPVSMALAKVSLGSLDYRNHRRYEHQRKIYTALRDLKGLKPVKSYPKARSMGFYGGIQFIYDKAGLDGLEAPKFVEAMNAEGVPIKGPGMGLLEHTRYIFTHGFDLWGRNRGPIGGEWCGLPPFKPYKIGDFPVAEGMAERVLSLRAYIDPPEGLIDQYIEAFNKVLTNYKSLL